MAEEDPRAAAVASHRWPAPGLVATMAGRPDAGATLLSEELMRAAFHPRAEQARAEPSESVADACGEATPVFEAVKKTPGQTPGRAALVARPPCPTAEGEIRGEVRGEMVMALSIHDREFVCRGRQRHLGRRHLAAYGRPGTRPVPGLDAAHRQHSGGCRGRRQRPATNAARAAGRPKSMVIVTHTSTVFL